MKQLLTIIIILACLSCHKPQPIWFTPTDQVQLDSIPVNPFEQAALGQIAIDTVQ